jgi:hypothetical protein
MLNEFKMMFDAATHCTYCRQAFGEKVIKTKDHVFPLGFQNLFPKTFAERGGSGYGNIVAACKRCNNLRASLGHSTERLMEFLEKKSQDFDCDVVDHSDVFASFSFSKKSMRTLMNKTKHLDPENFDECERIFSKFLCDPDSITHQERRFLVEQRTRVDRLVYEKSLRKKRKNTEPVDEDVSFTESTIKNFEIAMEQDHLYSLIVKAQHFSPQDVPAMIDVLKTFVLTGKISDPDLVMRLDKYK